MVSDHNADHAEEYLATVTLPSDDTHSYVQHLPLAPALMAGNVCLIKHDSHVPGCAQAWEGSLIHTEFTNVQQIWGGVE